jgi:predicted Zn-dependent protease
MKREINTNANRLSHSNSSLWLKERNINFSAKYLLIIFSFSMCFFYTVKAQNACNIDTLESYLLNLKKKNPANAYANYGLASIEFNRGNYKEAARMAQKNIKRQNDFDTACTILYARSLDMLGKYDKATEVYKKASKKYFNSPELWYYYAFTLYKTGKIPQSQETLEKSIRISPFFPLAHYLMGYCLFENNNNKACLQAFLFGILCDRDTSRTIKILQLMNYYILNQMDSINIPYFDNRLSMKSVDDLIYYNFNKDFQLNFYLSFIPEIFINNLLPYLKIDNSSNLYSYFFSNLQKKDLEKAFCYYCLKNIPKKDVQYWYFNNNTILDQLADFFDTFLTKPF